MGCGQALGVMFLGKHRERLEVVGPGYDHDDDCEGNLVIGHKSPGVLQDW